MKIESARNGKSWDEIDETEKDKVGIASSTLRISPRTVVNVLVWWYLLNIEQEIDLIKGYASKIQELEAELIRVQSFSRPCRNLMMDFPTLDDPSSGCDARTFDDSSK